MEAPRVNPRFGSLGSYRGRRIKQSLRSSTPRCARRGLRVELRAWEGTWAAVVAAQTGQVQVGRPFGSHRSQLRCLTVGGFLETFENPLPGRLFVSPQRRVIQRRLRRSRPFSPPAPCGTELGVLPGGTQGAVAAGSGRGRGGHPRRSGVGPPGPQCALRLEASSCRPPTPFTGSVAGWEATRAVRK